MALLRSARAGRLLVAGLALLAAASACTRRPVAPSAEPRNVILIVLDTLRADHLSSYGYSRQTSPNLDAFGAAHARFTEARSQAGCTYPSVNSLLTSRAAYRFLGQRRRHIGIPQSIPTLAERLRAHGLRTAAVSASSIVRRSPSEHNAFGEFDRGFDTFDESCLYRRADCVNRRARRFLNHTQDPFFLYLHYTDPHGRYEPPAGYRERFATAYDGPDWVEDGNARPLYESIAGTGPHVDIRPQDVQHLVDLYDGEIAYLDAQLGELLRELEARGLMQNTVIAITADHGEEFLEHGHVWHCDNVFETMLRVPLFLHVPGLTQPAAPTTPVENLDVTPTVLDALDIDIPAELEGRSLLPLLGGEPWPNRPIFALQNNYRSVTDGRRKLIFDLRSGARTLFDLAADPGETRDAADRLRPEFHAMSAALAQWLGHVEGSTAGDRAASEEARKVLEAVGYLK